MYYLVHSADPAVLCCGSIATTRGYVVITCLQETSSFLGTYILRFAESELKRIVQHTGRKQWPMPRQRLFLIVQCKGSDHDGRKSSKHGQTDGAIQLGDYLYARVGYWRGGDEILCVGRYVKFYKHGVMVCYGTIKRGRTVCTLPFLSPRKDSLS